MPEESKNDLLLKRVQVTIAILGGLIALVLGLYNMKKNVLGGGNGDIALTIQSDRRVPLEGAHVELFNSQNALVNAARTDRQGHYEKKDVPAGGYMLKVSREGFEPQAVTAQVDPKKSMDLEMVLRSLGQTQAGSPIRSALEEAGASWIKNLSKDTSSKPK